MRARVRSWFRADRCAARLVELVPLRWAAAHIAVGCLAGFVVAFVGTAWRRSREPEEGKR